MGSPVLQLGKPENVLFGLAVASLALWLGQPLSSSLLPCLQFVLALLLILGGLAVLHRLFRIVQWAARKSLWRVRQRMVAVFFFVGVLPISLGGLLVICGILLLLGPLAAYMITSEFTSCSERLEAAAEPLLWQLQELPASARPDPLERFHASASESFPGLAIRTDFDGATQAYPEGELTGPIPSQLLTHRGIVQDEGQLFLPAVAQDRTSASRVVLAVPVTAKLVYEMMPGWGVLAVEFDREAGEPLKSLSGGFQPVFRGGGMFADDGLPAPRHPLDWRIAWPIETVLLDWRTGTLDSTVYVLLTRASALWGTIFAQQSERTFSLISMLGYCLMTAFGANVLISLFIAISLTRTLTRAVNDRYIGTTHVNSGEFGYRVPVMGNDQVSDLSRSFNSMTDSIKRLIEDSKRRQQLEAELENRARSPSQTLSGTPPAARRFGGFGSLSTGPLGLWGFLRLRPTGRRPRGPELRRRLGQRHLGGAGDGDAALDRPDATFSSASGGTPIARGRNGPARAAREPAALRRDRSREVLDAVFRCIRSKARHAGVLERGAPPAAAPAQRPDRRRSSTGDLFIDDDPAPAWRHVRRFHGWDQGAAERERRGIRYAAFAGDAPEHRESARRQIIECVMDDVLGWTGNTTLQDDMTMLVMRRR